MLDGAHERIDLIRDPVAGQQKSEERAQQPQNPALSAPGIAEDGLLYRHVGEVGRAIANIHEGGEDQELGKRLEGEGGTEVWPGQEHPRTRQNGEGHVVGEAARLAVPHRIVKSVPEHLLQLRAE